MGSFGLVTFQQIWSMLDQCAPGYSKKKTDHHWRITVGARVYPTLPLGPHGKRSDRTEIQKGHVKKMARHLGILDCAQAKLDL